MKMYDSNDIDNLPVKKWRDKYILSHLDYFIIDGVIYTLEYDNRFENAYIKKVLEL